MSIFSVCMTFCCVCRSQMDYMHRYGSQACCCCKECFEEWRWRETLAIMRKPYAPRAEPKESES